MNTKVSTGWVSRCGDAGIDRIAYREWGHRQAPAVLCVHGLSRNKHDFDPLADRLASDFRVVAVDMPGRGASPRLADPARYRQDVYLGILRTAIDTLDLGAVHWVGTSMGGLLGMAMAAADPWRVASLVLNDVGPELDGEDLARHRRAASQDASFDDLAQAEAWVRRRYVELGPLDDDRWTELTLHGMEPTSDGRWRPAFDPRAASLAPVPRRVDLWSAYACVTCPVLVLRGEHSRLLSRAVCDRMALRDPPTEWIEVPGAGHAPDLSGAARIDPVAAFLARVQHERGGMPRCPPLFNPPEVAR